MLILSALFAAISGLVTFVKTTTRPALKVNRWHRWSGLVVALVLLMFASSGGLHLVKMSIKDLDKPMRMEPGFSLAGLSVFPSHQIRQFSPVIKDVSLSGLDNELFYRVERAKDVAAGSAHDHHQHHSDTSHDQKPDSHTVQYMDAVTGKLSTLTDHERAKHIALELSGFQRDVIKETRNIPHFDGEYGFVNKFLPVVRIDFDTESNDSIYIHTASATLASHITTTDRLEGWIFAYLHKWHFMESLGHDIRDSIMALFAFMISITTLLGMILFARRISWSRQT